MIQNETSPVAPVHAIVTRPILFSAPMVQAIIEGRKTQTRRNAKLPLPQSEHSPMSWHWSERKQLFEPCGSVGHLEVGAKWGVKPKYGKPGDRLWVRETWRPIESGVNVGGFDFRADDPSASGVGFTKWRPSIFMPREASRITLEIKSVRIERLHEISESDALAEGSFVAGSLTAVERFTNLWVKINGEGSFDANPWVWVVEFERV